MKKRSPFFIIAVVILIIIALFKTSRSFSFHCNSGPICDFISRKISNIIMSGTQSIAERSTPTLTPVIKYSTTHTDAAGLTLTFPKGWEQNQAVTEDSGYAYIAQFLHDNGIIFSISRIPKAPEANLFQALPQLVNYLHTNVFSPQSHQMFKEGSVNISNQEGHFFSLKYLQSEENTRPYGYLVYFYPEKGNEYFIFLFRSQNQFTDAQLDEFNSILGSAVISDAIESN